MASLSAITIYVFGLSSFLIGTMNLLSPPSALAIFDLPIQALPATNGNALAAIAMGIYYILAAYQENKTFFIITVPMRLLTTAVFWSHEGAWKMAAAWEGGGSLLTFLALLWEGWGWKRSQKLD